MKHKLQLLTVLFLFFTFTGLDAQTIAEELEKVEDDTIGNWRITAGIGVELSQLLQINPKAGAGADRIGLGTATGLLANYDKDRWLWHNSATWLFAIQRLGSGIAATNEDQSKPFEKTIDELRLASNLAYQTSPTSKWYYSFDFTLISQLTPTYEGNLLTPAEDEDDNPLSKLFSPAQVTLSPGVKYVPDDRWFFFLSPISTKMIVVLDDDIAALGIHGNPWNSPTDFENVNYQFGATLLGSFNDKFLNDKLAVKSEARFYTNYLDEPQNIDVDWRNQLDYEIVKGLSISLNINLFYDHDIPVQITDYDFPGGVRLDANGDPVLGRRLNIVEALLIKYQVFF